LNLEIRKTAHFCPFSTAICKTVNPLDLQIGEAAHDLHFKIRKGFDDLIAAMQNKGFVAKAERASAGIKAGKRPSTIAS
jgi:hypothetical protein